MLSAREQRPGRRLMMPIFRRTPCAVITLAAAAGIAVDAAHGQETYPVKPIRIVVTNLPGGTSDFFARVIGATITDATQQPVHRLPRMIPQKEALGMMLTGRRVSAQEGKALGFVNQVVEVGGALRAARAWADQILECSPMAIRASKEAVYRGLDEGSLEGAVRKIYPLQQANLESADYIEGPKAFAEKRKPNWQNR